jgi:hypothetical protein
VVEDPVFHAGLVDLMTGETAPRQNGRKKMQGNLQEFVGDKDLFLGFCWSRYKLAFFCNFLKLVVGWNQFRT